jgi:hypothetical protein
MNWREKKKKKKIASYFSSSRLQVRRPFSSTLAGRPVAAALVAAAAVVVAVAGVVPEELQAGETPLTRMRRCSGLPGPLEVHWTGELSFSLSLEHDSNDVATASCLAAHTALEFNSPCCK